jgi:hypothetical protein
MGAGPSVFWYVGRAVLGPKEPPTPTPLEIAEIDAEIGGSTHNKLVMGAIANGWPDVSCHSVPRGRPRRHR